MLKQVDFFKIGGALSEDAPSYVERRADALLLAALRRRELCLVLAPRQSGKSSLMVHAWAQLKRDSVSAGIIDLQPLGSIADPERWFSDVLYQIERSLSLATDSGEWWQEHERLGPTQRFISFVEDVILKELDGDVVLFIDEIDSILPLPFSDDFFTTIRALYNARAHTPGLNRLTFCLLGVAIPSSFVKDRQRTPFNIGTSVPLEDFYRKSVEPFRAVLGANSDALIDRIFHWTNGQPLMVQNLAAAVSAWPPAERTAARIDDEIAATYLNLQLDQDTHLKFIRDYLLDPASNVRETLGIYRDVLEGKPVAEDKQSLPHNRLALAGVVRGEHGHLAVRNRIYSQIFDLAWVGQNIRSEDLRIPLLRWLESGRHEDYLLKGRQLDEVLAATADRADLTLDERDFLMASTQFARVQEAVRSRRQWWVVIALIGMLTFVMVMLWYAVLSGAHEQQAKVQAEIAAKQAKASESSAIDSQKIALQSTLQEQAARKRAEAAETIASRSAVSSMQAVRLEKNAIAKEDIAKQGLAVALRDVDEARKIAYSRELAANSLSQLQVDPQLSAILAVEAVRATPMPTSQAEDALRHAVVPAIEGSVALPGVVQMLQGGGSRLGVGCDDAAYSPDGKRIITGSDGETRIWDVATSKEISHLTGSGTYSSFASFSRDGTQVVTAGEDGSARIWDVATGQQLSILTGHKKRIYTAIYSADGKHIVTASADETVRIWNVSTRKSIFVMSEHGLGHLQMPMQSFASYSPDGNFIVTGNLDGVSTRILDAFTGKIVKTLNSPACSGNYSPDGKHIVTGGGQTGKIWEVSTGKTIGILTGITEINEVSYSPDGRYIVSSGERYAQIWDAATGSPVAKLINNDYGSTQSVTYSPDGSQILTCTDCNCDPARIYTSVKEKSVTELLALARKQIKRKLTPTERQKYIHEAPRK